MSEKTSSLVKPEQDFSNYTLAQLAKFLIPTIIGVLLFLTPVSIDGKFTVSIALLIDYINTVIKPMMVPATAAAAIIPTFFTLIVSYSSLRNSDNPFLKIFNPGTGWVIIRVVGATLMAMTYFEFGPEWVWSRQTGGVMLYDVGPVVIAIYFLSAILLPLLTDYGLMEFVGSLLSKIFEKLFGLPGRAAVDCAASWLSASSVGIILTTQQYREGYYSSKDACTIATNFSIVSIAYAYLLLSIIGLKDYFIEWYLSVIVTGIICAIIVPRLPPLRNKSKTYNLDSRRKNMARLEGENAFSTGVRLAVQRADRASSVFTLLKRGILASVDLIITIYPAMMVIGCIGLAVIEYTTIFQTLSQPLVPYLQLLQLPEAEKAATALLAGIVDSIMPTILGASIESEVTRFVLAGVAVTQIIYFTEVAIVLLRAKIGLNLIDLLIVYALRVLISLPILAFFAHLLV